MQYNQISTLDNSQSILAEALISGWIVPYFQPLISTRNGTCCGAEVLARIRHPRRGMISPAFFIDHLTGQEELAQLTLALMASTQQWCRENSLPAAFMLTFNITPDIVFQPWLHSACLNMKINHDCVPVLELTEQRPLEGDEHAFRHATEILRQSGIRIALDDFGTGHAGLTLLRQAGGDYIKIPRTFISTGRKDRVNTLIIDNIIHLANSMNMQVIAEGVDSQGRLEQLAARGVEIMQGEYFSMPLDGKAFMAFMTQRLCAGKQNGINEQEHFIERMMSSDLLHYCAHLHRLSVRETQIAAVVARGFGLQKEAEMKGRSLKTCSVQKRSAYRKIGVRNDVEFIHYLYQLRTDREALL